ncbi:SURF1 family protein [beta proteobacterium MWH-UniP1]
MVNKTGWQAWIAVGVALSLAAIGVGLGFWQLGRADEKQAMMDLRGQRDRDIVIGDLLPWREERSAQSLDQQRVLLTGRWLADKSIALDNRAWEGQAGVHVLTPLQLKDGSLVWVNRGWWPKPPGVTQVDLPAPTGSTVVSLSGVALASVMRRMELSSAPQDLRQGNVWQNFDWAAAKGWLTGNTWPVIVWQTGETGDGLRRKVPEVSSDVPKHLGYALQWFLMSAAALFFAWRLRPKRERKS